MKSIVRYIIPHILDFKEGINSKGEIVHLKYTSNEDDDFFYIINDVAYPDADGQMENVINEVPWHNSKKESINNDIMQLLTENPEFKEYLVNLGVDNTFLGENPNYED